MELLNPIETVYEILLAPFEFSITDESGNTLHKLNVTRLTIDINPFSLPTIKITCDPNRNFPIDCGAIHQNEKFILSAKAVTDDIKDNCYFECKRVIPKEEFKYLQGERGDG